MIINNLILQTDNIFLKPLQVNDVTEEYVEGLNDPEVNQYLVAVRQHHQTKDSVASYVKADWEDPHSILFGIFLKQRINPLIGTVRVHKIDYFHFSASIGVCLFAKEEWKKGYAHSALQRIKNYLFDDIKLHYLEAGIYSDNLNSINCFLKSGFVEQHRVKEKYRHIDSFKEVIIFAAINLLFDSAMLRITNDDKQLKGRC